MPLHSHPHIIYLSTQETSSYLTDPQTLICLNLPLGIFRLFTLHDLYLYQLARCQTISLFSVTQDLPTASLSPIQESTSYGLTTISNDTSPNIACIQITLNLRIVGMQNQVDFPQTLLRWHTLIFSIFLTSELNPF